tara:strand:+ start:157 stop:507 length:351 start_codon:yes stop_codon:yes gene_type:complete
LTNANGAIVQVTNALNIGISGDLVAIDIRQVLHFLGEITGEISTDELLGTNFIELQQLDWADSIYVMETKHAIFINQFAENKFRNKVNVLHIKDIYKYNQKELINLLKDKFDFSIL